VLDYACFERAELCSALEAGWRFRAER